MIFILAFGWVELEEADELGVVHAFVLAGGALIPENDLVFAFPVAVGVVGLLIPLEAYRGKVGGWASREGLVFRFLQQTTKAMTKAHSRMTWASVSDPTYASSLATRFQ